MQMYELPSPGDNNGIVNKSNIHIVPTSYYNVQYCHPIIIIRMLTRMIIMLVIIIQYSTV